MEPTFEQYQELLKMFYRKCTKNHSHKMELNTKLLKRIAQWDNQLQQSQPFSKNALLTPAKSNKSLYSDDSFNSRTQLKEQQKQQKYFNCQWIFKHNNFKKVFCYALIYNFINTDNSYGFTKISEEINDLMASKNVQKQQQLATIGEEWSKIVQTFNKKSKVRWAKILSQIFLNFPDSFINIIFQVISKEKNASKINVNMSFLMELSRMNKISLSYFIINFKKIQSLQKTGGFNDQICIGFIKQEQKYVFSNKPPNKSKEEMNKQSITNSLSDAIQNLLKEYQSNTQKLINLDLLMDSNSQKKETQKRKN